MPLPEKEAGETRSEFMVRCMADDTMVEEFPDRGQRLAVCNSQWEADGDSEDGD